ncbi:MAG: carboxymuconolactone decarboxylase family protein [Terriglobales bacterium]
MANQVIEALDPITEELIGIAAAVASQCECCFTDHYNEALDLGVPFKAIEEAVSLARAVAERHQKHIDEFVSRRMGEPVEAPGKATGERR